MKESLKKEGLKPHLMIQPFGYRTPEVNILGLQDIKESPFGMLLCLVIYCFHLNLVSFFPDSVCHTSITLNRKEKKLYVNR